MPDAAKAHAFIEGGFSINLGAHELIENYFGISPDGGDGSLETMLFILLVMIGVVIGLHLPLGEKN